MSELNRYERLADLSSYDLTNPELRAELDEVSARTAEELGLPIALVTVVLDTAQLFIGGHGLTGWAAEANGTPAEWAFCAQMVRTGAPYVMPDGTKDPIHHTNPLVTEVGVRSYAGMPLVNDRGTILGGHCVLGAEPHQFTEAELAALHEATGNVMQILERYRTPAEATT